MKKVFYATIFICFILFSNTLPCDASQQTAIKATEVEVRVDKIIWKYKMINGKLYKRLYNATDDIWIGDWIPV